jgi:hypothetical protein
MGTCITPTSRTSQVAGTVQVPNNDELSADTVLPSQFFSKRGPAALKTAEHQLVLALLNDAVQCFCKYAGASSRHDRRLYREAATWIMDEPDAFTKPGQQQTPTFSFRYVCEVLGLDAGYLRAGLRLWRDQLLQARMTA